MGCTINGVNFDFDERVKKSVFNVAETLGNGHELEIASFLVDEEFRRFFIDNTGEDRVVGGKPFSDDYTRVSEWANVNQNKLRGVLKDYFKRKYRAVENSATKSGDEALDGFTSMSAKTIAKKHSADIIKDIYAEEILKPKSIRKKGAAIISKVNDILEDKLFVRADLFANDVIGKDYFSAEAKKIARRYKKAVTEINNTAKENKADRDKIAELRTQLDKLNSNIASAKKAGIEAQKRKDNIQAANIKNQLDKWTKEAKAIKDEGTSLVNRIDSRELNASKGRMDRYIAAQILIQKFARETKESNPIVLLNYANLVQQARAHSNEWYFQVFNTKDMTSVVKEFENVGDLDEYFEGQDMNTDTLDIKWNGETIDETTKSWEDSLYKSLDQTVSARIRLSLSRIPKLTQPYKTTLRGKDTQAYDTNNDLGVSTYMNAQELINQIYSKSKVTNREAFVQSLREITTNVPSLYGLGQITHVISQNKAFLNEMFAAFSKPKIRKTMLTIRDINDAEGIKFDYSNPGSEGIVAAMYVLSNKMRATYIDAFDNTDYTILNKAKRDTIENHKAAIKNILSKYFPNIKNSIYDNIFADDSNLITLDAAISNILNGARSMKLDINKLQDRFNAEYNTARKNYNEAVKRGEKANRPVKRYARNYDIELNSTANKGLIQLAEIINKYDLSSAKLQTANAEGNTSADIMKNSWVTRFAEAIEADEVSGDNAGLKNLLNYFTQGENGHFHNQYHHNPLLFGIQNQNGIQIAPGMFSEVGDGQFEINKDAKQMFSLNLFDGTKNTQNNDGAGYAKMSKLDFFITQFFAFQQSTKNRVETDDSVFMSSKVAGIDTAQYAMRIGSDAPKIFFVRAMKYNTQQLQFAFYQHFLNEINIACKGLNSVFTRDTDNHFIAKTNTHNLLDRMLYNGSIVKDGRLTGNAFKFDRLFDTGDYKASEQIEKILLLYGQDGLIKQGKDGNLYINTSETNSPIVYTEHNTSEGTIGSFELNMTDEVKNNLLKIAVDWYNEYSKEIISRSKSFADTMRNNGIIATDADIVKYVMNSVNMDIIYDDIFEGDFKFYKDARDFLKRTKETQAGGESYSNYDITETWNPGLHNMMFEGIEENVNYYHTEEKNGQMNIVSDKIMAGTKELIVPTYVDGKFKNVPMKARNGFRAVTIYNTKKAIDNALELRDTLYNLYQRQGIIAETAQKMADKMAAGFGLNAKWGETKINDAQSYITLEEFIRRKYADGTINDYKDLLDQILDPEVKAEDIDLSAINARIQVQKNFYYDKVYDAESGLFYPRQIKNAEYVLIPKLLPEGSELRGVYEWMKSNDIGQLNTAETSKAGKKNIFTIWDNKTGEMTDSFKQVLTDKKYRQGQFEDYVETYEYKYLYKQQDVPEHMKDEKNKAGIQIMKKIIDNIYNEIEENSDAIWDVETSETIGQHRQKLIGWANDYQEAFSANIKEDFNNFLDMMGWEINDAGKIINKGDKNNLTNLDFNQFYIRAREEAARLGMDSNFMEYLIPDDFTKKPNMPNFMNTVASKLESIAQSLFNSKITRQTLPGWHAAQITDVGYSDKLEFNAKTGEMEVYLPHWSKLIPKDYDINKLESEGLTIQLGYRIPTEGKQSISVIKVKGFLPDTFGSTIVVPAAWVAQTGSDFDVDSVYGISWEMEMEKQADGSYLLKKIPYTEETFDNKKGYIKYVRNRIENSIQRDKLGQEIDDAVARTREELDEEKENINNEFKEAAEEWSNRNDARNEAWEELPEIAQDKIKELDGIEKKRLIDENNAKPKSERLAKKDIKIDLTTHNITLINALEDIKQGLTEDEIHAIEVYQDRLQQVVDQINYQHGIEKFDYSRYRTEIGNAVRNTIEGADDRYFAKVQEKAIENGIESYEEYLSKPFVERLDRKGRNNLIIDRMIKIMQDLTSREEQYGRSQFEDITNANKLTDELLGQDKTRRSPYNPLDQIDYFDDVMAGARLKALSVNWDTLGSKINRVRAELSDDVAIQQEIVFGEPSARESKIIYDENLVRQSYGENIQTIDDNNQEIIKQDAFQNRIDSLTIKNPQSLTKYGINIPTNKNTITYIGNSAKLYDESAIYTPEHIIDITQAIIKYINSNPTNIKDADIIYYNWKDVKNLDMELSEGWKLFTHVKIALETILNERKVPFIKGKVPMTNNIITLLTELNNINPNIINDISQYVYDNLDDLSDKYFDNLKYDWENKSSDSIWLAEPIILTDIINKFFETALVNDNKQQLQFNFEEQPANSNKAIFTARRIAWSNNNRNLVGYLCSPYMSETTAHHLDAVKEGSVQNVNEYTFNVYKLMSGLGFDYETIISFMRQPAIGRIVKYDNIANSVFFKSDIDQVTEAIREMAIELNLRYAINEKGKSAPVTNDTPFYHIHNAILGDRNLVESISRIANVNLSYEDAVQKVISEKQGLSDKKLRREVMNELSTRLQNIKLILNKQQLFDRLQQEAGKIKIDNIYDKYAFDIAVAMTFNNIRRGAERVNDYINPLNADKFGAKQTIAETRDITEKVKDLRQDMTLSRNGIPMIELIYPSTGEQSVYPSINNVYRYATEMSYQINKQLFVMESDRPVGRENDDTVDFETDAQGRPLPNFVNARKEVEKRIGRRLSTKEYKEYKKYAVSTLYQANSKLFSPLTIDERGNLMIDTERINESHEQLGNAQKFFNEEYSRVLGYGIDSTGDFINKDYDKLTDEDIDRLNNPRTEDIKKFTKLTPVQKVNFIQKYFKDGDNIFNYINTTTYNTYDITVRGISRQYLNYNDQVDNIDDLVFLFKQAFNNHNAFIKLAAADMIKYAFLAEGNDYKSGYISKIIPNTVLYNNEENGGLDIINSSDGLNNTIKTLPGFIYSDEFMDNYVRSHHNMLRVKNLGSWPSTPKNNTQKINKNNPDEAPVNQRGNAATYFVSSHVKSGVVYINNSTDNISAQSIVTKLKLNKNVNGYIKVHYPISANKSVTRVFKVFGYGPAYTDNSTIPNSYRHYFLAPMNLLDNGEFVPVSYNQRNNQFADMSYYDFHIKELGDKLDWLDNYASLDGISKALTDGYEVVDNYSPVEGYDINDTYALDNAYTTAEPYLKGSVKRLVDGVLEHYHNNVNMPGVFVQFQPFTTLSNLIPRDGKTYTQTLSTNYGEVKFDIRNRVLNDRMKETIVNMANNPAINRMAYKQAIDDMVNSITSVDKAFFYEVSLHKETKQEQDDNASYATTETVGEERSRITPTRKIDNIDNVSRMIMNEINYRDIKEDNYAAREFNSEMKREGIIRSSLQSRQENKESIFTNAARYYQSTANYMLNKADKYTVYDGQEFDISKPELYEWLTEHDEEFSNLAKFILDGVTFGNRIEDIFDANVSAENKNTAEAIESIMNSINRIRQSEKFKTALKHIFNIYMKKFSSNPDIVNGILEVREAFGDIDFLDEWITNPSEIQNNQSQIVLKKVKEILNKAEMFDAKENQEAWFKAYDDIMSTGDVNMDNIIDTNRGILRPLNNEQFEKDRDDLYDKVKATRIKMRDSKEDYKKYLDAKYEYDKFLYKYTEQELDDDYYERNLAYLEEVRSKAGQLYYDYMYWTDQLYNTKQDDNSAETIAEKEKIKIALKRMKDTNLPDGTMKEMSARVAAKALSDYFKNRKKLNAEYFDYSEYAGFQEDYKNYSNYIKKYDSKHPHDTLEQKLSDGGYREAFNWIRKNAIVTHSEEMRNKIANAYKVLTGNKKYLNKNIRSGLKTVPGAIDENGVIDGRKLNDAQLELARKADSNALSINYDQGLGESLLIKAVPTDIPPIKRRANTRDTAAEQIIRDMSENSREKAITIQEINEIMIKAVDTTTGELSLDLFFNDNVISNEEREHLAELYKILAGYDANKRKYRNKANVMFEDKVSGQWGSHLAYGMKLTGTKRAQFDSIFFDPIDNTDENGRLKANPYIYNYKVPTEYYIDKEKLAARELLKNNVRLITTQYYELAANEAMSHGADYYNEWFKKNHIYNPFTHVYEPLSIWKLQTEVPGSDYESSVTVNPTFDNSIKTIKEGKSNDKYSKYTNNYKHSEDSRYNSGITLNSNEERMRNLFVETLKKHSHTHSGKMFTGKGYLPRDRQNIHDKVYYGNQALSFIGASWKSGSDSQSFSKERDYTHDAEVEQNMLGLLKGKGTKEFLHRPERIATETDESYNNRIAEWKAANAEILRNNEAIDNAILNKNWREVMGQFVHNATITNSKEAIKPYFYLLLEDLKQNNAHMLKGYVNRNVVTDNRSNEDMTDSRKEPLTRIREIMANAARRMIFDQYHENSSPRTIANMLQNLTSAKYMIFNLYGGIANVATGEVNMGMERRAKEYFGTEEFVKAHAEYLSNGLTAIANMYSDKAANETDGFVKLFDVVDFDQVLQFGAGQSGIDVNARRVRNWLYGLQSGGEAIMQNSVMLAMLDSHRLYTNSQGKLTIGDFTDYTRDLEDNSMQKAIEGNQELQQLYEMFRITAQKNLQQKYDITSGRKDYNREFLYSIRDNSQLGNEIYRNISRAYHAKRNELIEKAGREFKSDNNKTVRKLFKLVNGKMILDVNSENLSEIQNLIAGFRQKIIDVNQKIHGVYDKTGAAMIEKTWWGSLVMQYHKHLYTGIFKRWRRRGYFSEVRGTKERGTRQTLIDFLLTEFNTNTEEGTSLASIQNIIKGIKNTFANASLNWNNLSRWEQANIKRNLSDYMGMLACSLLAFAIYAMWDDDEINDSRFISSLLYTADRCYSEASMYSPFGLSAERQTLWSSPIAAGNTPADASKGIELIFQALTDPEFDPVYSTGAYKGRNKFAVLFKRNIPGVRVYDRIKYINKQNKHYKIGNNNTGIKNAKWLARLINNND